MIDLKALAHSCGFYTAADMNPKTLKFMSDVRSMCAADRCQSYGKSWSCPPACGELEYWEEKASHYSKGLILQTVGDREDSYDFEAMMEVSEENKRQFLAFTDALKKEGITAKKTVVNQITHTAYCVTGCFIRFNGNISYRKFFLILNRIISIMWRYWRSESSR